MVKSMVQCLQQSTVTVIVMVVMVTMISDENHCSPLSGGEVSSVGKCPMVWPSGLRHVITFPDAFSNCCLMLAVV